MQTKNKPVTRSQLARKYRSNFIKSHKTAR